MKHFATVTTRSDPEGGIGLDTFRLHRRKAGTIERDHAVLMNERSGWALTSRKISATAAWLNLKALFYNPLSAMKCLASSEEMRNARAQALPFLSINIIGELARHAGESLLRFAESTATALAHAPSSYFVAPRPALAGVWAGFGFWREPSIGVTLWMSRPCERVD